MTAPAYIPLSQVSAVLGRRVHINSLLRWVKAGSRGVRLRADFIAGRWYTTEEWVREFVSLGTSQAFKRANATNYQPLIDAMRENEKAKLRLKQKWGIEVGVGPRPHRRRQRKEPDGPDK